MPCNFGTFLASFTPGVRTLGSAEKEGEGPVPAGREQNSRSSWDALFAAALPTEGAYNGVPRVFLLTASTQAGAPRGLRSVGCTERFRLVTLFFFPAAGTRGAAPRWRARGSRTRRGDPQNG